MECQRWIDIVNQIINKGNPFEFWTAEIQALGISETEALNLFTKHYMHAYTTYNFDEIKDIFQLVNKSNKVKYKKLLSVYNAEYDPIQNYNMKEESNDLRLPDLTATSTGNATSEGEVKNNQSRNTTDTPQDFKEVTTSSVNPYDNSGLRDERSNVTTQTGSRTVVESYSGAADTTSSTSNSTSTTTQTGQEKYEHKLTRQGNIGVTSSQQLLESEIQLAQKMNIFKMIEKDLASQIFLQVW